MIAEFETKDLVKIAVETAHSLLPIVYSPIELTADLHKLMQRGPHTQTTMNNIVFARNKHYWAAIAYNSIIYAIGANIMQAENNEAEAKKCASDCLKSIVSYAEKDKSMGGALVVIFRKYISDFEQKKKTQM
jgi:hypothetical protein